MSKGVRAITVFVACVSHRHGMDHWVAASKQVLAEQLYEYVQNWWSDWDKLPELPADPHEAVQLYFEAASDAQNGEFLDTSTHEIVLEWESEA